VYRLRIIDVTIKRISLIVSTQGFQSFTSCQGGDGANNFQLIKLLVCKPKKYFSANQRNCLNNLPDFSFKLNLIKAIWFTDLVHDYYLNDVYSANAGDILPWLTLPEV